MRRLVTATSLIRKARYMIMIIPETGSTKFKQQPLTRKLMQILLLLELKTLFQMKIINISEPE